MTVAILFCDPRGAYSQVPDVNLWDEQRDARLYAGPWPIVAHPPCSRWCRLAGLVEARWGHKRGEDGGCFASALASVRRWGGVLEHPAYSDAWETFRLPVPNQHGGWQRGLCGGWTCQVNQFHYGHRARKATWLYAFGTERPRLRWGGAHGATAVVSYCRNHRNSGDRRPEVHKRERSGTPPEFRDVLLAIARSARQPSQVTP